MKVKILTITICSFVLISFLFLVASFFILNMPAKTIPSNPIDFKIDEGESGNHVVMRLKNDGLIRSSLFFKVLLKIKNKPLKVGLYAITKNDSSYTLLEKMVKGAQRMLSITIPEGKTIKQVATLLEQKGVCNAAQFINEASKPPKGKYVASSALSYEGFIFPDTYFIPAFSSPSFLLETFMDNFEKRLEEIDSSLLTKNAHNLQWVYRQIILASIIEKEYKIEEEAPLIASVFMNRLYANMPLQSCATIVYIMTELQNRPHPKRLFYTDLEIDNPYNSYINYGLPPSPICSPGSVALDSVLNPVKTGYYYFVVKDSKAGTHHFSSNYSNHQQAKIEYINRYFN